MLLLFLELALQVKSEVVVGHRFLKELLQVLLSHLKGWLLVSRELLLYLDSSFQNQTLFI